MRIALTTWGFPTPFSKSVNGIAASTAVVARHLARAGHPVVVITSHADGMPPSYLTEDGVEVHQAHPGNWHWYLSKFPRISSRLVRFLKLWEIGRATAYKFQVLARLCPFDIVEVGPPAPWLNPSFRRISTTKCVAFIHGSAGLVQQFQNQRPSRVEQFWNYAEKQAAQVTDGLMAPSRFVANFYGETFGRLPMVLPLAVQVPPQAARLENNFRMIALGGTGEAKGGDLVIQALPAILSEYPQASLSLISAGGKSDFAQLKANFPDRVRLLPWLSWSELQNEFLAHSIFISPSRFETFGLTVAEAMAVGLAVVVSDLPSHRELVTHGETGLTFTSGDAVQLADAVRYVVQDAALQRKLAARARAWVRDYLDPVLLTRRRVDYYQSLFQNGPVLGGRADE